MSPVQRASGGRDGFRLSISGGAHAAGKARREIARLRADLDPPLLESVRLLVTELVTNSVRHAGAGTVELAVLVGAERVRVEIANPGSPFEPVLREDGSRPPMTAGACSSSIASATPGESSRRTRAPSASGSSSSAPPERLDIASRPARAQSWPAVGWKAAACGRISGHEPTAAVQPLHARAAHRRRRGAQIKRYSLARVGDSRRSALGEDRHERLERAASFRPA